MELIDLLMSLDAMTNILVEWDKAVRGRIVCDTQAYIAMAGDSSLSEDTMSADVTGIQVCVNKTINSEYDSALNNGKSGLKRKLSLRSGKQVCFRRWGMNVP